MNYVVGFAFAPGYDRVVLIEKKKPEWQAGLLNGVGGKQEPGEHRARDTMEREFLEETGVCVPASEWVFFADMLMPMDQTRIVFFFAETPEVLNARTMTTEEIGIYGVDSLRRLPTLPNLQWLVPLAVSWSRQIGPTRTKHIMIMEESAK